MVVPVYPTRKNKVIRVFANFHGLETIVKLKWVSNGITGYENLECIINVFFIFKLKSIIDRNMGLLESKIETS